MARELHFILREWHGNRQSFLGYNNVFEDEHGLFLGMGELPPQRHENTSRPVIKPGQFMRYYVRWNSNSLRLAMNDVEVLKARILDEDEHEAAPAMAELFIWVFAAPSAQEQFTEIRALASPIRPNTIMDCQLCGIQRELTSSA